MISVFGSSVFSGLLCCLHAQQQAKAAKQKERIYPAMSKKGGGWAINDKDAETGSFAFHTHVRFVLAVWPGLFLQYVRDVAKLKYIWNTFVQVCKSDICICTECRLYPIYWHSGISPIFGNPLTD